MKLLYLSFMLASLVAFAQSKASKRSNVQELSLVSSMSLAKAAQAAAQKHKRSVTFAVVGKQGETILLHRGDGVGPHNTEAARRKAFTSLSTGTSTLELLRKSRENPDMANLASLPELLLLSGGYPLRREGVIVGAVGVAGGGSPEIDHAIAEKAAESLETK